MPTSVLLFESWGKIKIFHGLNFNKGAMDGASNGRRQFGDTYERVGFRKTNRQFGFDACGQCFDEHTRLVHVAAYNLINYGIVDGVVELIAGSHLLFVQLHIYQISAANGALLRVKAVKTIKLHSFENNFTHLLVLIAVVSA